MYCCLIVIYIWWGLEISHTVLVCDGDQQQEPVISFSECEALKLSGSASNVPTIASAETNKRIVMDWMEQFNT